MAYAKIVENDKTIHNASSAEQFLLEKVYSNTQRCIGTELEVFVVKEGDTPRVTYDDLSQLTQNLCYTLQDNGYNPSIVTEPSSAHGDITNRIVVPGMGVYCFEPGGQYEMAVSPASNTEEASRMLFGLYDMLDLATQRTGGMNLVAQGHHEAFFVPEITYPRTRFTALYRYYDDVLSDKATAFRSTMNSCCGFQINLDAGADKLHEFQGVLTVMDPVLGLLASNSPRKNIIQGFYRQKFPQQVFPLMEALHCQSPEESVHHIMKRLQSIHLPVQLDANSPEGFVVMRDEHGNYPTIGTMLSSGAMTESSFTTCLSQQIYGGNLRGNGSILETRAPDSTDPETASKLIPLYSEAVYNDGKRAYLLKMFRDMDTKVLSDFLGRALSDPVSIKADDDLDGRTVKEFVGNIMDCVTEGCGTPRMTGYKGCSDVFIL